MDFSFAVFIFAFVCAFASLREISRRDAKAHRNAKIAVATLALGVIACGAPAKPNRLVIAIESAPLTLDPRGAFNTDTAHVQQLVFDTLVRKGPDFDFAPGLATAWTPSPDWTECTFELRPGVMFHDGRAFTSRDVVFTFGSLASGGFGKSSAFEAVERVEATGPLTVRIVSKRPNPGLIVDLVAVGILPEGSGPEAATRPIGTGPFRITTAYAGEGDLALEHFDDFVGGHPAIDGVDIRVMPDASTRAAAIEAGEVDLAINPGFAPDAYERFDGLDGRARVETSAGGGVQFVVLNVERPGLSDGNVRRAMAMAVDRELIIRKLLGGRARLAVTPLPLGHWAYANLTPVSFGPVAARQLLADAGKPIPPVELMTLPTTADRDLAAVLQEYWQAIGIPTTVVTVERAVFIERLARGDFGAAIHRFTGGNQFTTIFKGAFHSRSIHDREGARGELNYARFADSDIDARIDEADGLVDRADRVAANVAIQKRLADAFPWILLWHPDNVAVAGPRVGPFALDRSGDFHVIAGLTIREE